MSTDAVLETLRSAASAVRQALDGFDGKGLSGQRVSQYHLDVVADDAACAVLLGAGLAVFSEESGERGSSEILVVIDPVDGSTNADRGIPFYCVSLCALDDQGPLVSLVENLPLGIRYEAIRGQGATRDGRVIAASGATDPSRAIVGVNGVLDRHPGWAQVRTMGAAALELCLVADGSLDGYVQAGGAAIHPWDYLAGIQIAQEAGATVISADGDELMITERVPRRPLAAATDELAAALVAEINAARDSKGDVKGLR
jgi:fructose-1,6-bisphosphatase/inositol monophosphatase family enzyme